MGENGEKWEKKVSCRRKRWEVGEKGRVRGGNKGNVRQEVKKWNLISAGYKDSTVHQLIAVSPGQGRILGTVSTTVPPGSSRLRCHGNIQCG